LRGFAKDVLQVGLADDGSVCRRRIAILIVEFANENHDKGMEMIEATVHAATSK